jgi:hypothetical protein
VTKTSTKMSRLYGDAKNAAARALKAKIDAKPQIKADEERTIEKLYRGPVELHKRALERRAAAEREPRRTVAARHHDEKVALGQRHVAELKKIDSDHAIEEGRRINHGQKPKEDPVKALEAKVKAARARQAEESARLKARHEREIAALPRPFGH